MSEQASPASGEHFDVGQHAYEHAKKAWGFGKGLPIVKFFLGSTEAVAGKMLQIGTGKKLEDVDNDIMKPGLSTLDGMLLNPTISKVLGVVLPAFSKVEEMVKPVVVIAYGFFLKPSVEMVVKLAPCSESQKKKTEHPSMRKNTEQTSEVNSSTNPTLTAQS